MPSAAKCSTVPLHVDLPSTVFLNVFIHPLHSCSVHSQLARREGTCHEDGSRYWLVSRPALASLHVEWN